MKLSGLWEHADLPLGSPPGRLHTCGLLTLQHHPIQRLYPTKIPVWAMKQQASAKERLLSPPPSAVHPHIPPVLITQSASAGQRRDRPAWKMFDIRAPCCKIYRDNWDTTEREVRQSPLELIKWLWCCSAMEEHHQKRGLGGARRGSAPEVRLSGEETQPEKFLEMRIKGFFTSYSWPHISPFDALSHCPQIYRSVIPREDPSGRTWNVLKNAPWTIPSWQSSR